MGILWWNFFLKIPTCFVWSPDCKLDEGHLESHAISQGFGLLCQQTPQPILICSLHSERSINTSVDRSFLLPSKSKWVQGWLEYWLEDECRTQSTSLSPPCQCKCFFYGKLWCTYHRGKLISSDIAREMKGHP